MYIRLLVRNKQAKHVSYRWFGPVKHANVEVPQAQPAVHADAAKPVILSITPPRVEGYRGNPRVVTGAPGDEGRVGQRPDRDEIVLSARHNILAVRRPTDACYPTRKRQRKGAEVWSTRRGEPISHMSVYRPGQVTYSSLR